MPRLVGSNVIPASAGHKDLCPGMGGSGTRLIGMRNDTGVEERGGFETILVQKIGADQLAAPLRETGMRSKGILHFPCAMLEDREKIAMPAIEVGQRCREQRLDIIVFQCEHAIDNVIGPRLVDRIEVPRLQRRTTAGRPRARDPATDRAPDG